MAKPAFRSGMTLIELLLVIAIIGTLVALVLPAVQAARESSRRASCLNNLKQIGLAINNYESAQKAFPPGAIWDRWPPPNKRRRHGSILVQILPYMEQRPLYDAFDFTQLDLDKAVFPGTNTRIGATVVDSYLCPSDDNGSTFGGLAMHNYSASNGPTEVYDNPNCSCAIPYSKSLEMAPIDNEKNFAGPFTRLGVRSKPSQITDGLSKTIFVGEVRVSCSVHAQAGWAYTNNGSGYCTTLIRINFDTCNNDAPDPCHRPCTWNTDVGFKSAHPSGAQFLFGDGSVHFLNEDIDMQTYQYLGAKADGQVVSIPL
jgi:prepilin-type N-terminal cleavage/methylation domain-containing protein/prepilin-type processing-associated H-X9-DG protein